jgi:hypothetical protein
MTGLEDRISTVQQCPEAVARCRNSDAAHAHMSAMCRQVACFVIGVGGKTGGTIGLAAILTIPGRTVSSCPPVPKLYGLIANV